MARLAQVGHHHARNYPRLSSQRKHPPFMALSACCRPAYTGPAWLRKMVEARLGGEQSPGSAPASPAGGQAAEGSFPERLDPEVAPAPLAADGQMRSSTRAGDRASFVLAAALLVALSLLFVPWSPVRSGLIGQGGHGRTGAHQIVPGVGAVPLAARGGRASVAYAMRLPGVRSFEGSMAPRFRAAPLPGPGGQASPGSAGPSANSSLQRRSGDRGPGHDEGIHRGRDHHQGIRHQHSDRGHHEGHDGGGDGRGQGHGRGHGDQSQ